MRSKVIVFLLAAVVTIEAAPATSKSSAEIVKYEYEHLPDNGYRFFYELTDGQFREENGSFIKSGDDVVLFVTGSFGFTGEDGKKYVVNYTSDENGFIAYGDHIPKSGEGEVSEPPPPQFISPSLIATLAGG